MSRLVLHQKQIIYRIYSGISCFFFVKHWNVKFMTFLCDFLLLSHVIIIQKLFPLSNQKKHPLWRKIKTENTSCKGVIPTYVTFFCFDTHCLKSFVRHNNDRYVFIFKNTKKLPLNWVNVVLAGVSYTIFCVSCIFNISHLYQFCSFRDNALHIATIRRQFNRNLFEIICSPRRNLRINWQWVDSKNVPGMNTDINLRLDGGRLT